MLDTRQAKNSIMKIKQWNALNVVHDLLISAWWILERVNTLRCDMRCLQGLTSSHCQSNFQTSFLTNISTFMSIFSFETRKKWWMTAFLFSLFCILLSMTFHIIHKTIIIIAINDSSKKKFFHIRMLRMNDIISNTIKTKDEN
jgi:hypothetical protein